MKGEWLMRFGKKLVSLIMSAAMAFTFAPGIATASLAKENGPDMTATGEMAVPVYGLYNPNSGEHFFTANEDEAASLTLLGWEEGDIKWYAPVSGDPVYRLYNPNVTDLSGNNIGDHHYTMNPAEVSSLIEAGWQKDDALFYSASVSEDNSVPVFGVYNPNAYALGMSGAHHFTINADEIRGLLDLGWQEGYIKFFGYAEDPSVSAAIDSVIENMSMDEKISQMIIPAFRTWNGTNMTDLSAATGLAEALKKHQYGGIILYSSNITGTEQVTRLLDDLQNNNLENGNVSTNIPYLTTVDEEGGIVIRLNSGTRMTGNMAIGATADSENNAEKTGIVLGEELAAVGFNTDFAPDIDVNNNPSNPVIGTRSFSDDPLLVSKLGVAYSKGLAENNIIATYKHFPGHGDTATDSHIGTPSVEKTYEEIQSTELVPFKNAIENGADMIMTAHITYPLIDDEVTFGDGVTKGYYPATMSKKMITDILRNDLNYDGVVVTDALEMAAIGKAGLVPGENDSTEYRINIAKEVINAGVDLLLLPVDLNSAEVADFYDDYISGIEEKVNAGEISEERINESVRRILKLKQKYHIFDARGELANAVYIEDKVRHSLETVGSLEHHDEEMRIAREAITLVKNDNNALPLSKDSGNVVVLGRLKNDLTTINSAMNSLKESGAIGASSDVTVDFYYDSVSDVKLHYTDELKEKIKNAGTVIGFSNASGSSYLNKDNANYIALQTAIEDTHKAGGRFVLISQNLPYDSAVYKDADAIVLAYLSSGLNLDPTEKTESGIGLIARNANILAALDTVFGLNAPKGKLPVNVPVVLEQDDGTLGFGKENLYQRGFGLNY